MEQPPDDATNLTDPGTLLAAIPAMMGFVPNECLIVLHGSAEGLMEGAIRIDIDAPKEEFAEVGKSIDARVETMGEGGMCIIVLVTPTPSKAIAALQMLIPHLQTPIREVLGCVSLEPGAEWMNPVDPEMRGKVPDWRDSIVTFHRVSEGRQVFHSEKAINAVYDPVEPVSPIEPVDLEGCTDILTSIAIAFRDGDLNRAPSPGEIGAALNFGEAARELALTWCFFNPSAAHLLYTEVGKRVRGQARVHALTFAGIAAYMEHSGSLAMGALRAAGETAMLMDPPYTSDLLELASDAYFSGVRPEEFKKAFIATNEPEEGGQS